jgi:hypothetical protein
MRFMRKSSVLAAGLFLGEFLCLAWVGWDLFSLYRRLGASWEQALVVGETQWSTAFYYAAMSVLYCSAPRLRLFLAAIGVLAGVYGAFFIFKSPFLLLGSLNPLHGNFIALGVWSEIIMVFLGLTCVLEIFMLRRDRAKTR